MTPKERLEVVIAKASLMQARDPEIAEPLAVLREWHAGDVDDSQARSAEEFLHWWPKRRAGSSPQIEPVDGVAAVTIDPRDIDIHHPSDMIHLAAHDTLTIGNADQSRLRPDQKRRIIEYVLRHPSVRLAAW